MWFVLLACGLVGFLAKLSVLFLFCFIAPMMLAIATFRSVGNDVQLARRRWYYVLVSPLLASSAATAVGAGMTLVGSGEGPFFGFLAIGTTNAIVAMLTWRALVRPSPRSAALAGLIATLLE